MSLRNIWPAFLVFTLLLGSCAKYYTLQGDKKTEQLNYPDAARNYEKAVAKKYNAATQKKLADTYRMLNETKKGMDAYAQLVNTSSDPMNNLYYARMLMANKKYKEASDQFKIYLKSYPNDKSAQAGLQSCENTDLFMKDSAKWVISPAKIGDIKEFFGPVKYKDGLVFSANLDAKGKDKVNQTGKSYYKLYFTKKDKTGTYTKPEKLTGNINQNKMHSGMASYTQDGSMVYYTVSNNEGKKKDDLMDKVIGLKIKKDTITSGTYISFGDFPFNSDAYSTGHPAVTPDGRTLYFISDMPGGSGGTDIYETHREKGQWTAPMNLGDKINTPGNEMFPYVDSLGNLYFSSDGFAGLGGLDVFMSRKDGKFWTKAENLNYPLNSSKDDFGFMIYGDGKSGYVSSNREGSDRIYEFILQAARIEMTGKIFNKKDMSAMAGVKIEITDKSRNLTETIYSGEDGTYSYMLAPKTIYAINVSKDGYFAISEEVNTQGKTEKVIRDYTLEEIKIDVPVVIDKPQTDGSAAGQRPIFYDFDSFEIRPDAYEPLNKLAKLLNDNQNITIELSSHTDCRGENDYNMELSDNRAKSAKSYLVKKGVKSSKIKTKGYGESKPVNKCVDGVPCSDEEYQENRRTEFKVIEIGSK